MAPRTDTASRVSDAAFPVSQARSDSVKSHSSGQVSREQIDGRSEESVAISMEKKVSQADSRSQESQKGQDGAEDKDSQEGGVESSAGKSRDQNSSEHSANEHEFVQVRASVDYELGIL